MCEVTKHIVTNVRRMLRDKIGMTNKFIDYIKKENEDSEKNLKINGVIARKSYQQFKKAI